MTEARILTRAEGWQIDLALRCLAYNWDAWALHQAATEAGEEGNFGWPSSHFEDLPEGSVLKQKRVSEVYRDWSPSF
jgi:hypothetical protein